MKWRSGRVSDITKDGSGHPGWIPTLNRIVLRAVRPGTSGISLSVLKLDAAFKPTASEPVADLLEIMVQ